MWTDFYCYSMSIGRLREILEQGADPNAFYEDNIVQPPLHVCCARGDPIEFMETLLQYGADPNRIHQRYSALHLSARRGDVERMRILLRYGANPDLQDTSGWTPLHLATPFSDAVRLLIEHGAELDLLNKRGETALEMSEGRFAESTVLLKQN